MARLNSHALSVVLLSAVVLSLSSCATDNDSPSADSSSASSASSTTAGPDPAAFLADVDTVSLELALDREPTDDELLRVGQQFCDTWKENKHDGQPGGPLGAENQLNNTLSGDDLSTLHAIFLPAEDYLCPELFD